MDPDDLLLEQAIAAKRAEDDRLLDEAIAHKRGLLNEVGRGLATGVAQTGYSTVSGLADLFGADEFADRVRDRREQFEEDFAPVGTAGKVAQGVSRIGSEIGAFVVPGRALSVAGRAAGHGSKLARLARPETRLGKIGRDFLVGAPLDAAIEAGERPEQSFAGAFELPGHENKYARAAYGVGLGVAGSAAAEYAGPVLRRMGLIGARDIEGVSALEQAVKQKTIPGPLVDEADNSLDVLRRLQADQSAEGTTAYRDVMDDVSSLDVRSRSVPRGGISDGENSLRTLRALNDEAEAAAGKTGPSPGRGQAQSHIKTERYIDKEGKVKYRSVSEGALEVAGDVPRELELPDGTGFRQGRQFRHADEGLSGEQEAQRIVRERAKKLMGEEGSLLGGLGNTLGAGAIGGIAGTLAAPEGYELEGGLTGAAVGAGATAGVATSNLRRALADPLRGNPDVKKVRDMIGSGDDGKVSGAVRWLNRLRTDPRGAGVEARTKIFRDILPLERMSKDVRNALSASRGSGSAAKSYYDTTIQPALALAGKAGAQHVETALASMRAIELLDEGLEKTGIDRATHQRALAASMSIPGVRDAVKAIQDQYRALLDMKLKHGVISQDNYNDLVKKGRYYIPFVRIGKDGQEIVFGSGKKRLASGSGVRRMDAFKAKAKIVNPFEQLAIDTAETFNTIGKQHVSDVFKNLVDTDPAYRGVIDRVKGKITPDIINDPQVVPINVAGTKQYYRVKDQEILDALERLAPSTSNLAMRLMQGAKNVLRFGVTTTPSFAAANMMRDLIMTGMQQPIYRTKAELASKTAAGLAGGAFGASTADEGDNTAVRAIAGFGAGFGGAHLAQHMGHVYSALTDILGNELAGSTIGGLFAGITADDDQNEFVQFLKGAAVGAVGGSAGRLIGLGNNATYREFLSRGGGGGSFHPNSKISRAMAERGLEGKMSLRNLSKVRTYLDAIEHLGSAIEMAPRLAHYKRAVASGMSKEDAIFHARDLSLDFSIKPGSKSIKGYTDVTAFANPALQGYDKLARVIIGNKGQNAVLGLSMIMAPSMALWYHIQNDPELADQYNDISIQDRNSYWFVPNGEGGFNRIPKPFEVGAVFASLPERMLEFAHQKNPDKLMEALGRVVTQYSPAANIGLPTAIEPTVEAMLNYDIWRDRPVDPFPDSNLFPEQQSTPENSSLSVAVNRKALERASPARIDHVLKGHTGTLGDAALRRTSEFARQAGWDDRAPASTKDRPVFGRFTHNTLRAGQSEINFKEDFDRAEKAYNGFRRLADEARMSGDPSQVRDYAQRYGEELRQFGMMREMKNQIDELSELRRDLRDLPKGRIDESVRRDRIAQINAAIRTIAEGYYNSTRE